VFDQQLARRELRPPCTMISFEARSVIVLDQLVRNEALIVEVR